MSDFINCLVYRLKRRTRMECDSLTCSYSSMCCFTATYPTFECSLSSSVEVPFTATSTKLNPQEEFGNSQWWIYACTVYKKSVNSNTDQLTFNCFLSTVNYPLPLFFLFSLQKKIWRGSPIFWHHVLLSLKETG